MDLIDYSPKVVNPSELSTVSACCCCQERDGYKGIIDSYESEVTMSVSGRSDAKLRQNLEDVICALRKHNASLEADVEMASSEAVQYKTRIILVSRTFLILTYESVVSCVSVKFIYATADEADAYMFYRCFFCFLFFSVFFPSVTKIPDNLSREWLNGFSCHFYQTIAGKM